VAWRADEDKVALRGPFSVEEWQLVLRLGIAGHGRMGATQMHMAPSGLASAPEALL